MRAFRRTACPFFQSPRVKQNGHSAPSAASHPQRLLRHKCHSSTERPERHDSGASFLDNPPTPKHFAGRPFLKPAETPYRPQREAENPSSSYTQLSKGPLKSV
jgi:hypothetical protein